MTLEQDFITLALADADLPFPELVDLFVANGWAVEGDVFRDPAGPGSSVDRHDIAVFDFAGRETTPTDVRTFTPATLPTAGQLDALGSRVLDGDDWLVVGYGAQEAVSGPRWLTHSGGGVRLKAPVDFNALDDAWVRLAMNASRDLGVSATATPAAPTTSTSTAPWCWPRSPSPATSPATRPTSPIAPTPRRPGRSWPTSCTCPSTGEPTRRPLTLADPRTGRLQPERTP